jgi:hypothetical protein
MLTDDRPYPPPTTPFARKAGQQFHQHPLHQLVVGTNTARAPEGKHDSNISIVVPSPTVSPSTPTSPTSSTRYHNTYKWTSPDIQLPRLPAESLVRSDVWGQRGQHRGAPRARPPLCDSQPSASSPLIRRLGRDRRPKSCSGGRSAHNWKLTTSHSPWRRRGQLWLATET